MKDLRGLYKTICSRVKLETGASFVSQYNDKGDVGLKVIKEGIKLYIPFQDYFQFGSRLEFITEVVNLSRLIDERFEEIKTQQIDGHR